jgi:hypothetical protein
MSRFNDFDYKVKYYKKKKSSTMKFGWKEINTQVPKVVRRVRSAIIYTLAGSLVYGKIIAAKFGTDPATYAEWVGIIMLVVRGFSSLFGIEPYEEKVTTKSI